MTRDTMKGTMTHQHLVRAAAASAAVLVLTACASTPPAAPAEPMPTSSTSTPSASPSQPAQATLATPAADNGNSAAADAVADAVAATMWSSDTRTDPTAQATAARAVQWMTPAYAAIATEPLPSGGGAEWLELTQHQGYLLAEVLDADDADPSRPADTATTATRVRIITLTPRGAEGWTGEPRELVATMTLVQQAGTWLVDAIVVDEAFGASEGMQDFG